MHVQEKKYTVQKLVDAFNAGSLLRNPEYQRGESWTPLQKAAFIDSIFRAYPVPTLFLHETPASGLDDAPSKKYEIVDGQQRLTALRDFAAGKFRLLGVDEKSKVAPTEERPRSPGAVGRKVLQRTEPGSAAAVPEHRNDSLPDRPGCAFG